MHLPNRLSRLLPAGVSHRQTLLLRALITAAALAAVWAVADLNKAVALVAHADLLLVAAAIALLVLRVPLMARRWQIILAKTGTRIGLWALTRISYVSMFFGVGLPSANGNDLVRGAMLKRPGISLDDVVASVVSDRAYGILSTAFLALPGAAFLLLEGHGARIIQLVLAGSVAVALLSLGLLFVLPRLHWQIWNPSSVNNCLLSRLTMIVTIMAETFSSGSVLTCLMLSLVSQSIAILAVACAGAAVHAGEPLALYFALVPVVWIATMLPLTISGLGMREAGFAFLFQTVGSSAEHGLAIGAIASATGLAAAVLGGLALLTKSGRRDTGGPTHTRFSLPLLVVAGMPRTGTTTIYRNLERHPGFETSLRKELNHFLYDVPRRPYRDYFPRWQEGTICVDVSPFYSLDSNAAARLRAEVPQARVVLLVREPAKWIFSVYTQSCSFVRRPPTLKEFIASPWLPHDGKPMHFSLAGGLYAGTISRFAQAFGDQLAVIDFAALERDPLAILQDIERFAGATAFFRDGTIDGARNNSSEQAHGSFPLVRNLLQRDLVINAGLAVVPPVLLRAVRARLYYSSGRNATLHAPEPQDLEIARAATRQDRDYYAKLFEIAAIRRGSELL